MITDPWRAAAIVRFCQRCRVHKSIGKFDHLAKLCKACIPVDHEPTNYIVRTRAIVLTDKGREAIGKMAKV